MIGEQPSVTPTTVQRAKLAYVYVRQSSMIQVTRHAESTDVQYALVERAVSLGWPRDRIELIDDDLGKSGAHAEARGGFQRMLAEISLAHVGLVLSFDASRLARNNRDWYQLLEVCSIFGVLIADGERLYDPRQYHDRLLLGLSGMMSEAELHHIKQRMYTGARHKAARGELRLALPVGLARMPTGEVIQHPDDEIRARLQFVFHLFRQLRSASGVMRSLRVAHLPLPVRPLHGPAPHDVVWQEARASSVRAILQNPAYAGAYVYGRKVTDPTRRTPGHPCSGVVRQPIDKWEVCLHNRYPAYISWEEYLANQAQLCANQNHYRAERHGVPRQGVALLQGIVRCGMCGALLSLRYSGVHGNFPVYVCSTDQHEFGGPRCQEVRALALDAEIEQRFLAALQPDRVAVALAALTQLEQDERAERKQWDLRLERARYDAQRAERQYQAAEPEHRLVARSLERLWEEKLRAVEALEKEYQRWRHSRLAPVTPADREAILALGTDLPALWNAPTTTAADRKQMIRLVIRDVSVHSKRSKGQVWVQINWQTGAHEEFCYQRSVRSYADAADGDALEQRVRDLNATGLMDADLAAQLNAEGYRTAHQHRPFTGATVWALRAKWQIATVKLNNGRHDNPTQWEDGTYSITGAAAILGVYPGTIYHWIKDGKLTGQQSAPGMPWKVQVTSEDVTRLQAWLQRARRSKKEG
jgi:DNA invertase Pin-like site-specific DNA recombinase